MKYVLSIRNRLTGESQAILHDQTIACDYRHNGYEPSEARLIFPFAFIGFACKTFFIWSKFLSMHTNRIMNIGIIIRQSKVHVTSYLIIIQLAFFLNRVK